MNSDKPRKFRYAAEERKARLKELRNLLDGSGQRGPAEAVREHAEEILGWEEEYIDKNIAGILEQIQIIILQAQTLTHNNIRKRTAPIAQNRAISGRPGNE